MSVDKNVPEIRFKGFSGDWEHKKFKDIVANLSGGASIAPNDYKNIGKRTIPKGAVNDTGTADLSGSKFVSIDFYEKNILSKASSGDLVTSLRDLVPTAPNMGRVVKLRSPEENFLMPQGVYRIELANGIDENFVIAYSNSGIFRKIISREKNGSTQVHIRNGEFLDIEIIKPKPKEQTKIGSLFQKLDSLINQNKQKHDKLSNIKKAMLEKMFPKQGETIPEIRFKGFSGEWEERSWWDTVNISTNMVDPRNNQYGELFHVGPGNIESFTGRFYENVLKVKDSNLISGKFHFNKGDIIYGKINPQLAKYVIAPFEGLASADAYVLNAKNGVVQSYLFTILQSKDFYKYTVSVSSRTGMPKINRDELSIYSYLAPIEQEQALIGNYFQKFDALINQHQQQLTKLNNIKQACLAKIFI